MDYQPFLCYIIRMSDYSNQISQAGSGVAEDASIMLPPERKVVFYNDDFTTMEFVVDVLVSIFNKSHSEAEELMQTVHQEGSSVLGVYTKKRISVKGRS